MVAEKPIQKQQHTDVFASLRELNLSVIVPVFNEAAAIKPNLEMLIGEISPYFSSFEILVISDGSTDATAAVLRSYKHPNVRPIIYDENHGKGYAVRSGFKEASGDYVFFIDGGMELHPREIRIFLGLMALYDSDIVVASKRHPQSRIDYPRVRRVLSACYQQLVKYLFDMNVTDTQVGLKLFKKAVIDAVLPDLTVDRYGADLEILALARLRGFRRILEAPVRLDYFHSNSRPFFVEMIHIFRVGVSVILDTLRLYLRLKRLPPSSVNPFSSKDKGSDTDQFAA